MTTVSFLHSGCPIRCIALNLLTEEGWEQFPRRLGTGFFARRGTKIYYLTARHCLTKELDADIAQVAVRLHIPYFSEGHTLSSDDYVSFDEAISLRHNSPDIPGELLDLVVLSVAEPKSDRNRKHLLSRAAKLPPTGEWLDEFIAHPVALGAVTAGAGITLCGIGYPYEGTQTDITYADDHSEPLEIVTQAAKFTGQLSHGGSPDRLMLNSISWSHDLNGFSGSPVFVGHRTEHGPQYALAGMIVSGGGGRAQFIRISVIRKGFEI
jgi:hypothetical protein